MIKKLLSFIFGALILFLSVCPISKAEDTDVPSRECIKYCSRNFENMSEIQKQNCVATYKSLKALTKDGKTLDEPALSAPLSLYGLIYTLFPDSCCKSKCCVELCLIQLTHWLGYRDGDYYTLQFNRDPFTCVSDPWVVIDNPLAKVRAFKLMWVVLQEYARYNPQRFYE